jgi:hypothetical protein
MLSNLRQSVLQKMLFKNSQNQEKVSYLQLWPDQEDVWEEHPVGETDAAQQRIAEKDPEDDS